jgi:hypothetical protein
LIVGFVKPKYLGGGRLLHAAEMDKKELLLPGEFVIFDDVARA